MNILLYVSLTRERAPPPPPHQNPPFCYLENILINIFTLHYPNMYKFIENCILMELQLIGLQFMSSKPQNRPFPAKS